MNKYLIFIILLLFVKIISIKMMENHSNVNISESFNNNKKYNNKKYNIAIMTIFKNEHYYLEEWLNHHISQGIEHIYMYCNDPNIDNYPYLLNNKYKNFITLIDWVNKKNNGSATIQRQAYTHCVKTYSNNCQFILMLDIDEFIIPIKNYNSVAEYIYSLKSNWDSIKAFKIQRYDFGSNGHIQKPDGPVVSNYFLHEKTCATYKTMANTDYVNKNAHFFGVHDFNFIDLNGKVFNEYFGYHETGYPNGCKDDSINEIPLVINHYYTKSYEEYISRCKMWENGGINPINYRIDCEKKFKSRDVNDVKGYD